MNYQENSVHHELGNDTDMSEIMKEHPVSTIGIRES